MEEIREWDEWEKRLSIRWWEWGIVVALSILAALGEKLPWKPKR